MDLRPYTPADLDALYAICLRTGNAGTDASTTCTHPRLLGDYFAAPYAAHAPELCLVLADAAGPCGYILGAVDTGEFVSWFNTAWLPRIRQDYLGLTPAAGASDAWLFELVKRDAVAPSAALAYPAHLHIDLLPGAQGTGWGRRLFEAWTALARARGAAGVHLGVSPANTNAQSFYQRMGMTRLETESGAVMFGLKL